MKNTKLMISVLLFVLMLQLGAQQLLAQTAGSLVFTVTTTSTGGYSPKNVIAIWIQNSSASFIKTKIRYVGSNTLDHLSTWSSASGGNIVDATTGATRLTHGTLSFIWDATNVSGTIVPDGTYYVYLQMDWSDVAGDASANYSFVKGPTAVSSNPANTANFLNMSLTWTPSVSTGIDYGMQNDDIRVFPNPTSGLVNIDFKHAYPDCIIQVVDDSGILVYKNQLSDVPAGPRSLDLKPFAPGIYYITLHMPGKDISFRVVKTK